MPPIKLLVVVDGESTVNAFDRIFGMLATTSNLFRDTVYGSETVAI